MPDSTSQARRWVTSPVSRTVRGRSAITSSSAAAGPWSRSTAGYTPRAIDPEPLQQLVQRDAGPAQRVQRLPRVRRGGVRTGAQTVRGTVERAVQRVEPFRGRVRQLADQPPPLDLPRAGQPPPGLAQLRGQLVGLADALVQLDAPLHAAQQEPGAVGHVLHEPLVGRGDRAVRLLDRQRGPQLRAVEHRHHVVGVGPGEQHREVVRGGRRRPSTG